MSNTQNYVQQTIRSYWNHRAATYDSLQRRENRKEADEAAWTRVASTALPSPPGRVFDAGTGSGYFAFILANLGYDVIGCDISEKMIDIARRVSSARTYSNRKSPEFVVGDAINPEANPGSFDAITSRYLMWTLPDPLRALLNWKRLIKPGGALALIDAPWFPAGLHTNQTPGFAEAYSTTVSKALPLAESSTIDETVALVKQAGYHHVQATPLNEIYHLDQLVGAAPGHHVQLQYLITAKTPQRIKLKDANPTTAAQLAIDTVDPQLQNWTTLFSMASDPTRLRILVALHAAPSSTVIEIATALNKSPNTITQALARLEKTKLAASTPDGRFRRWRITDQFTHDLLHHMSAPHSHLNPG